MKLSALIAATALLPAFAAPVRADDAVPEYKIAIEKHHFVPPVLKVKAGTKFKLTVENKDAEAEEFEIGDLKREKVIAGGTSAVLRLGPLAPGTYKIAGEYHEDTASGRIEAE